MEIAFGTQMFIYYLAVAMTLATMLFFLVKGKRSALLYSFIVFQIAVLAWILRIILVKLLINSSITPTSFEVITYDYYEWIHYKLRYFINCLTGLCWLVFSLLYTAGNVRSNKKWFFFSIGSFLPVYFLPILISDILSGSQFHSPSAFWIHAAGRYAYYLIGMGLLIKYSRRQTGAANKQGILLLVSILLPVVLTFVQDFKRSILLTGGIASDFDITPLGFIAAMSVIAVATYRYRFLNIIPMALQKLVRDMNQAIVVMDSKNRMMDCNPAFTAVFTSGAPLEKNKAFGSILQLLKEKKQADFDEAQMMKAVGSDIETNSSFEMSLSLPQPRYFSVEVQPIAARDRTVLGKVVSFRDVTEYKNLLKEIRQQYEELSEANAKLKEYASVAQELAVANERNRFSRDLHDTLGHTMTMLVALLEVSDIACGKDPQLAREKIREAASIAREGLREIQRSIAGILPGRLESESLAASLETLAAGFRAAGVDIEFTADGTDQPVEKPVSEALYRACQEALTNALRHGKASQISVIFKTAENRLKLYIIDNGHGCPEIHKGYGIIGMEQRINALGGSLTVGSDGESGFHVGIEIPLSDQPVQV